MSSATLCADCKTTGGVVRQGRRGPRFFNGAKYGFSGPVCERCNGRHRVRLKRGLPYGPGSGPSNRERAERPIEIRPRPVLHPRAKCSTPRLSDRANGHLAVLTPSFQWADLIPRAAARLEVIAANRRARAQRALHRLAVAS